MSVPPEDITEEIRRLTGARAPGAEPSGLGSFGPSNAFARMSGDSAYATILQLERARYRPPSGAYAQGRLMHEFAQRQARREAERNVASVNQFYGNPDFARDAPWIIRKKMGITKRGALYTLGDVQRNVVRQNQAVRNAITQAQIQANARAARLTADTLRSGGALTGSVVADHLQVIGQNVVLDIFERRQLRDRRANILRVGRRGALSTRAPAITAVPGRTGALATRPLATVTRLPTRPKPTMGRENSAGVIAAPQLPSMGELGEAEKAATSSSSSSESSKSATKSRTSTRTPTIITPSTHTPTLTGMSALAGLAGVLTRVRARVRASTRALVRPLLPQLTPTAAAAANPLGLTSLNAVGVGSRTQEGKCDCPKPKKPKQKAFPCSNPLVSRSVTKDGIITIKRKLLCPSSKPKPASPPVSTTTTSSPDLPSKSREAAPPFPPVSRRRRRARR